MAQIDIKNLNFKYAGTDSPVLKDISLSIEEGDFVCICGPTGCGKTTLLKMLKKSISPNGEKSGEILIDGKEIGEYSKREEAELIGYVSQNPDSQIVTDKVWHELAFCPESLGYDKNTMRSLVAQTAMWFGIENIFDRETVNLSGGEKQLVNLASSVVVKPRILLLDEPTAQLDPIASANFIDTITRLNRELSITVIIAEHNLEEVLPICNKLVLIDEGKILSCSEPSESVISARGNKNLYSVMPSYVKSFLDLDNDNKAPLSVSEFRKYLISNFKNETKTVNVTSREVSEEKAIEADNIYFRFSRDGKDILSVLSFSVNKGEIYSLMGLNGSGKSTLLSILSGIKKPLSGKVRILGRDIKGYRNGELYKDCLVSVPQDPTWIFSKETVEEELKGCSFGEELISYDLKKIYSHHPYDISGGERQLVVLAKALSKNPKVLLLDEPTKGLDFSSKGVITKILKELASKGITVLIVTHDVEFACDVSDRCGLLFNGTIVSEDIPEKFFAGAYYSTSIAKATSGIFENIVRAEDLVKICSINERK